MFSIVAIDVIAIPFVFSISLLDSLTIRYIGTITIGQLDKIWKILPLLSFGGADWLAVAKISIQFRSVEDVRPADATRGSN